MKNTKILLISLALVATTILAHSVQAFNGTISTATAQTGKASVENAESLYLNPAAITYSRGYFFNFTHFNNDQVVTSDTGYAITFLDNEPDSAVPVSLGFVAQKMEPNAGQVLSMTQKDGSKLVLREAAQRDMYLGVANFLLAKLSMGFTFHHLNTSIQTDEGDQNFNQNNLHWGMLYTPSENLGFGLVFYDILSPDQNIAEEFRLQSKLGLGVNYIFKNFIRLRAEIDSAQDLELSEPIQKLGFESYVADWFVTRFGYQNNQYLKKQTYSAGLGFIGPRFHLNYAMQMDVKDQNLQSHAIDFNLPF